MLIFYNQQFSIGYQIGIVNWANGCNSFWKEKLDYGLFGWVCTGGN